MIKQLSLQTLFGEATTVPLDHPGLIAGFYPVEGGDVFRWRWTNGDALIDPSLFAAAGPFVMHLTGQFDRPEMTTNATMAA